MLAQGGDRLFAGSDELVSVAEVIEHNDPSARAADPYHLGHHFAIVRHRRHHIGGHHRVEAVILKFHLAGIHAHQFNMHQLILQHAPSGFLQHPGREIDSNHPAI